MTSGVDVSLRNRSRKKGYIAGQVKVDTLLAFVFGVVFVVTILVFAVTIVNPTPFQIRTFQTVLALAAGGVAAVLPGQFELKHLPFIRAGGALAVTAAVYFAPPALVAPVTQLQEPSVSADPVVQKWLTAIDSGNYTEAWQQMDPASRQWFHLNFKQFQEVFGNARKPLGKTVSRTVVSRGDSSNPPNSPPGLYRTVSYLSKFENSPQCVQEFVAVRATENLTWRVFTHQVSFVQVPCLATPVSSQEAPVSEQIGGTK